MHALIAPTDTERPSTRARLTAVGDDWQAIFGFQGGDVDLIREFNDPSRRRTKRQRSALHCDRPTGSDNRSRTRRDGSSHAGEARSTAR